MNVIWTKLAELDRFEILRYIAMENPAAAYEMNRHIADAVSRLLQFPQLGRIGRVKGTRELVIHANYIVVYKLAETDIAIVNIIHAARQYP